MDQKVDLSKKETVLDLLVNEKKIEENLKQSLQLLKNSLTTGQEVKEYFDYHKNLRKEQKTSTLQDIDSFLELSKNSTMGDQDQLQSIQQDERSRGLYETSQKIKQNIQQLSEFYNSKQRLFANIKAAHYQIQKNLLFLQGWTNNHQNFAQSLDTLQKSMTYVNNFKANKAMAKTIAGFGIFIVFVLLVILQRLSSHSQVSLKI